MINKNLQFTTIQPDQLQVDPFQFYPDDMMKSTPQFLPQGQQDIIGKGIKTALEYKGVPMPKLTPESPQMYFDPTVMAGVKAVKGVSQLPKAATTIKGFIKQEVKPVFQGLKNLSTKLLEKFRGMPEEITPQQFNEIVNKARKEGLRKVDEDLIMKSVQEIRQTEPDRFSAKVNLPKLAAKVEEQLVPLTPIPVKSPRWSNVGADFIGDGKYGEIVYQSPIKTSAGDVHFQWNSTREGKRGEAFPNYFSHIRYEDMADGKTRKILETQSDLFQKENFAREKDFKFGKQTLRTGTPEHIQVAREKIGEKAGQAVEKRTSDLQKLSTYESNDPLAQLRTFREEVKRAAKDGKDTILIPSGETAMKIEGLGDPNHFIRVNGANIEDALNDGNYTSLRMNSKLKIGETIIETPDNIIGDNPELDAWIITDILGEGKFKAVPKNILGDGDINLKDPIYRGAIEQYSETFDISGKADTQHFVYKLNEEAIPREARKMGLNVEGKVNADNGDWWKISIPSERGKMPVEAFAGLGIGAGIQGALEKVIPSREIRIDNKLPQLQDENDKKRVAATIFGEVGNFRTEKEAREILSVIINRTNETGQSLSETVQEPNQFTAFGGEEFQKYFQQLDEPTKNKSKIIDKIMNELESGTFKTTKINLKIVFRGNKTK